MASRLSFNFDDLITAVQAPQVDLVVSFTTKHHQDQDDTHDPTYCELAVTVAGQCYGVITNMAFDYCASAVHNGRTYPAQLECDLNPLRLTDQGVTSGYACRVLQALHNLGIRYTITP